MTSYFDFFHKIKWTWNSPATVARPRPRPPRMLRAARLALPRSRARPSSLAAAAAAVSTAAAAAPSPRRRAVVVPATPRRRRGTFLAPSCRARRRRRRRTRAAPRAATASVLCALRVALGFTQLATLVQRFLLWHITATQNTRSVELELEWMSYDCQFFFSSSGSRLLHCCFVPSARPPTHPMVIALPYTCWCGQKHTAKHDQIADLYLTLIENK